MREVHSNFNNNWWLKKDSNAFHKLLFDDKIFYKSFIKSLLEVSNKEYLNKFYNKNLRELNQLEKKINSYEDYKFPRDKIEKQAELIRQSLNPLKLLFP